MVVSAEELAFGSGARAGAGAGKMPWGRRREGAEGEGEERGEREGDEGVKGLAGRVWMGDERPGWQGRRLEREREELGRGKGYGDIIMGQVREVFPGFGGRGEEGGEGEGRGK